MTFTIKALRAEELDSVAEFLSSYHREPGRDADSAEPRSLKKHLYWRLIENPFRRDNESIGYGLYRSEVDVNPTEQPPGGSRPHRLVGVCLMTACHFSIHEQELRGLASGVFFVDASARMQGYPLFRRILNQGDYDFHFANTCNVNSAKLWKLLKGREISSSGCETLLPLRLGPLIQELVTNERGSRIANGTVRYAVNGLSWLKRQLQYQRALRCKVCDDWDKLAQLSRTHSDPSLLTVQRTSDYFRWMYEGRNPVFTFCDSFGREGWFAFGRRQRGEARQIRSAELLDLAFAVGSVSLARVMRTASQLCEDVDVLTMPGRADFDNATHGFDLKQRSLPVPSGWVYSKSDKVAKIASRMVLAAADRL